MAIKVNKSLSVQQQKKILIEEAWLRFYNQLLYEKGLITERERNLMLNRIDARTKNAMTR